jgi:hypothetical protein
LLSPHRTDIAAAVCALVFVIVLAVSAWWDRSIRVLHVFEAMPYVLAAVLCLRRSTAGYALGVASGGFWLWCGGVLSTFIRNGLQRLDMLIRTGTVDRPDVLISVPAAAATAGLVLFSLAGYARAPRKSWRDLPLFAIALLGVAAFFIAIFAAFAPQFLGLFRRR